MLSVKLLAPWKLEAPLFYFILFLEFYGFYLYKIEPIYVKYISVPDEPLKFCAWLPCGLHCFLRMDKEFLANDAEGSSSSRPPVQVLKVTVKKRGRVKD